MRHTLLYMLMVPATALRWNLDGLDPWIEMNQA